MEVISLEEASNRTAIKTISLIDNDRALEEWEIIAEEQAVYFPVAKFKRVKSIPGTLAYLLRNFKGRNEAVAEFLKESSKTNNSKWLKDFMKIWPIMDDYSRNRVDVFDLFCDKWQIPRKKFWGVLQEGIFDNNEALTQTALSEFKPQFVELLKRHIVNPKNHQDRKLFAEVTGLRKEGPFITVSQKYEQTIDNRQVTISSAPSFAKSIKRTEIPAEGKKALELSDGTPNYIDAEFSIVEEKELQESKVA